MDKLLNILPEKIVYVRVGSEHYIYIYPNPNPNDCYLKKCIRTELAYKQIIILMTHVHSLSVN